MSCFIEFPKEILSIPFTSGKIVIDNQFFVDKAKPKKFEGSEAKVQLGKKDTIIHVPITANQDGTLFFVLEQSLSYNYKVLCGGTLQEASSMCSPSTTTINNRTPQENIEADWSSPPTPMHGVLTRQENRDGEGGDAWKVFQSQGQARAGPGAQDPFATYEVGRGVQGEGPRSSHEEPGKAPGQGGKGLKEALATDATTQGGAPLIPEKRIKLTAEGRQAVPRPGVGDEAEAGAKNNQGAGKQKGTTSEAVRSPKPHVQSIAKNKAGVKQQKEIAEPSKVSSPTKRNKAKKKQGLGKGKEKSMSIGSPKPHEDIPAEKTQGTEIQKETAGSFEDPRMQKKKASKKPGSEKPTQTAMSSKVVGSQIMHENSAGEKKQNVVGRGLCCRAVKATSKEDKGEGVAWPTEKVQVPKEVKKPKGKDTSAPPNLSKASEQLVKRKLPLQAATLGSLSKRAKVGSSGLRRVRVGFVSTKDEDTVEDSLDQLEEYEKRRPTKQAVKVKKEEKVSDLVKIHDSSDEEEVQEEQEEAEDEGAEEESGEEEEKSICQEGEEEEDEGGDEEGGDDEEEGGEKGEEEGRESDEDGSDGEKTDEGEGSTEDDKDSKDDGKGSGDDGKRSGDDGKGGSGDDRKGDEEGDHAESMNGSDEGDGVGASTDGSGSDERDGVGWMVEDEESTPELSGGGATPGVAIALVSMKGCFSLGLSFTSMEVMGFLEGNMY
ncbi:hypothetical protein L7F22_029509 [Adiantum nelumboides]|nr:hypothetical protein [Adiantum nelumboides]